MQFLYNFIMAQVVDAGGCSSFKPFDETSGQYALVLDVQGQTKTILYAPNWCVQCKNWKPPRSHHCSACRRCVLRMDHHCPFLGNCVGLRNMGHFFLMYLFAIVSMLYSVVLLICVFRTPPVRNWHRRMPIPDDIHTDTFSAFNKPGEMQKFFFRLVLHICEHLPWAIWDVLGPSIIVQCVLTVIGLMASLFIGCPWLFAAASGTTTIEAMFPGKELLQIDGEYWRIEPFFYRQRWWRNIGEILGPRWFLRLLLPVSSIAPSVSSVASPQPGPDGRAALLERLAKSSHLC